MSTIKSSREIDTIFKQAERAAHPLVIALVSQTAPGRGPCGRVAFVAGKKLGNAVKRNRCKRVLRASARRLGGSWPGFDVIFIAREGTADAPSADLDAALRSVLMRRGVAS